MKNPWQDLQPGILKAISKDLLAHDFYWYVEARNKKRRPKRS